MGDVIAAVQTNASAIVTATAGLGDVAFGVGQYKDRTTAGDAFDYQLNTAITKTISDVSTGLATWSAFGGGDTPEQALYALSQVAVGPAPNTTGWRAGAAKLVVWFGDAPSHDPSGSAPEPLPRPVSLADTITNLTGQSVKVLAVNIVHGSSLDDAGQATAITTATSGSMFTGLPTTGDITSIVSGLITSSFDTYHTVSLDLSDMPSDVSASFTPITGDFSRDSDNTFTIPLTFTDLKPGEHIFDVYVTVDGVRVATEHEDINSTVPEPGMILLLGSGLIALVGLRKRIKK